MSSNNEVDIPVYSMQDILNVQTSAKLEVIYMLAYGLGNTTYAKILLESLTMSELSIDKYFEQGNLWSLPVEWKDKIEMLGDLK